LQLGEIGAADLNTQSIDVFEEAGPDSGRPHGIVEAAGAAHGNSKALRVDMGVLSLTFGRRDVQK
jgi:hypothetical protein